jgi:hypothetical protein
MMRSVLARVEAEVGRRTEEELQAIETPSTAVSTGDLSFDVEDVEEVDDDDKEDVEEIDDDVEDAEEADEDVKDSPLNEQLPESIEGVERDESSEEDDDEGTLLFREEIEGRIFG